MCRWKECCVCRSGLGHPPEVHSEDNRKHSRSSKPAQSDPVSVSKPRAPLELKHDQEQKANIIPGYPMLLPSTPVHIIKPADMLINPITPRRRKQRERNIKHIIGRHYPPLSALPRKKQVAYSGRQVLLPCFLLCRTHLDGLYLFVPSSSFIWLRVFLVSSPVMVFIPPEDIHILSPLPLHQS